jgi:hypothetical protein
MVAGCGSGEPSQDQKPVTFPAVDDVVEIRASLQNSPSELPDVSEFVVPPGHWESLLAKFQPMKPSQFRNQLQEIGTLRLKLRDESQTVIHWYWNGQHPLEFVVNGQRCTRAEYEVVKTGGFESGVDEGLRVEGQIRRLRNELPLK